MEVPYNRRYTKAAITFRHPMSFDYQRRLQKRRERAPRRGRRLSLERGGSDAVRSDARGDPDSVALRLDAEDSPDAAQGARHAGAHLLEHHSEVDRRAGHMRLVGYEVDAARAHIAGQPTPMRQLDV